MSAECNIHGCDLVYGDGDYPDMFCQECKLEAELATLREQRDEYAHRLVVQYDELVGLREKADFWEREGQKAVDEAARLREALEENARHTCCAACRARARNALNTQREALEVEQTIKHNLMNEVARLREALEATKQELDLWRRGQLSDKDRVVNAPKETT